MKFDAPHFRDENAARSYIEALRWPDGRVCPHCGSIGTEYETKRAGRLGRYRCGQKECRKDFTVTSGTVMESSHIKLPVWLTAFYLMASSKKGMSAHQLHRMLDVTYKTAWFLCHRIREAMRTGGLAPMGGKGGMVEVDETYIGRDPDVNVALNANATTKNTVMTLIDRNSGRAQSLVIDDMHRATVMNILRENVAREAHLMTDQHRTYMSLGPFMFARHDTVNHSAKEYVREGQPEIHTNTVEGFYSIFKRGMKGVYQHASKRHLHRYAAEFDFRYSNRIALGVDDSERAARAVQGAIGKRLTYRRTNQRTEA